jgi:hypothetical protein
MKYDKKKLKVKFDNMLREESIIDVDVWFDMGYVNALEAYHVDISNCVIDSTKKIVQKPVIIEDVSDEVKDIFTFKHFDVACIGKAECRSKDGHRYPIISMFNKIGNIFDVDIAIRLIEKHHWEEGEVKPCCACIPPDDDLHQSTGSPRCIGVSICHDRDNNCKKTARLEAYEDSKRGT